MKEYPRLAVTFEDRREGLKCVSILQAMGYTAPIISIWSFGNTDYVISRGSDGKLKYGDIPININNFYQASASGVKIPIVSAEVFLKRYEECDV
jgi:hypothetical protein